MHGPATHLLYPSTDGVCGEIWSFLAGFVARAIAEGPQADRARRGRELGWPKVPDAEWYDWRWQLRNRVTLRPG
jgi:hypothetical protein